MSKERDQLYFQLVANLAPVLLPVAPEGLCHLAADLADAAIKERRTQRLLHVVSKRWTEAEIIAELRADLGPLPLKLATREL